MPYPCVHATFSEFDFRIPSRRVDEGTLPFPSARDPLHNPMMSTLITSHAALTRIQTQTQMLDFGVHKEVGFVGSCTYEFYEDWGVYDDEEMPPPTPIDPEMLRLVNLLADFVFYCGTGYKTTMGMEQTRRVG